MPPDLVGNTVQVHTRDGRTVQAHVTQAPTGTVLRTISGRTLPTEDVSRVVEPHRGRAALEGLLAGAGVGAAVGALSGYLAGATAHCTLSDTVICFDSPADHALFLGILGGGLGAYTGMVVGALLGSHDTYEVNSTAAARRRGSKRLTAWAVPVRGGAAAGISGSF